MKIITDISDSFCVFWKHHSLNQYVNNMQCSVWFFSTVDFSNLFINIIIFTLDPLTADCGCNYDSITCRSSIIPIVQPEHGLWNQINRVRKAETNSIHSWKMIFRTHTVIIDGSYTVYFFAFLPPKLWEAGRNLRMICCLSVSLSVSTP